MELSTWRTKLSWSQSSAWQSTEQFASTCHSWTLPCRLMVLTCLSSHAAQPTFQRLLWTSSLRASVNHLINSVKKSLDAFVPSMRTSTFNVILRTALMRLQIHLAKRIRRHLAVLLPRTHLQPRRRTHLPPLGLVPVTCYQHRFSWWYSFSRNKEEF